MGRMALDSFANKRLFAVGEFVSVRLRVALASRVKGRVVECVSGDFCHDGNRELCSSLKN